VRRVEELDDVVHRHHDRTWDEAGHHVVGNVHQVEPLPPQGGRQRDVLADPVAARRHRQGPRLRRERGDPTNVLRADHHGELELVAPREPGHEMREEVPPKSVSPST
jgi:hypothetical protein